MAGSYRKLKNGKWELCVSLGFDIRGKRIKKYKTVTARNKSEAEKYLSEFVVSFSMVNYNKGSTLTLDEFFKLWMNDYALKSLRKKTISRYRTLWPRISECLGRFEIGKIRPIHVIQFYNILRSDGIRKDGKEGGLSSTTIKHHHALLSAVLNHAYTWELVNSNPCSRVKLSKLGISTIESKRKTEEMMYSISEIKYLLKLIDKEDIKYRTIIYLAIFTGCRREEIMGWEWSDINLITGEIKVLRSSQYNVHDGVYEDDLKTDKSRRVCFIPKKIVDLLNEYKIWWDIQKQIAIKKNNWIPTNRLFIRKNGGVMHPDTPSSWFNKFLKRSNLPHTRFHNLRHLHCSILISVGMNPVSVADQMGHADLSMIVRTYLHNLNKNSNEVTKFMSEALLEPSDQ